MDDGSDVIYDEGEQWEGRGAGWAGLRLGAAAGRHSYSFLFALRAGVVAGLKRTSRGQEVECHAGRYQLAGQAGKLSTSLLTWA